MLSFDQEYAKKPLSKVIWMTLISSLLVIILFSVQGQDMPFFSTCFFLASFTVACTKVFLRINHKIDIFDNLIKL